MLSADYLYIHFNKQKIFPCFTIAKFLLLFTQEKNSVTDFLVSSWDILNITVIFLNHVYTISIHSEYPFTRKILNELATGMVRSTSGDCLRHLTARLGAQAEAACDTWPHGQEPSPSAVLNTPPDCRLHRLSRDGEIGLMCLYMQLYVKAQPFQRVSFPPVPSKKWILIIKPNLDTGRPNFQHYTMSPTVRLPERKEWPRPYLL